MKNIYHAGGKNNGEIPLHGKESSGPELELKGNSMDYAKESLRLHGEWKGKIEVTARVPVETKDDLSLAYTPGVA